MCQRILVEWSGVGLHSMVSPVPGKYDFQCVSVSECVSSEAPNQGASELRERRPIPAKRREEK